MLKHPDRGKWRMWLDRINGEMAASGVDRHVFDRWWSVIGSNAAIDVNNRFVGLIWSSYFERQTLTVRRQLDCDKQAISLVGLMREVAAYATQLHRADFLNAYTSPAYPDAWQEAQALFTSFADPAAADVVSGNAVQGHIDGLQSAFVGLQDLADKWLAHSDRSRQWPGPSFDQLSRCLDLLYATWRRYHALAGLGPIEADFGWLAGTGWEVVLDVPWRAAVPKDEPPCPDLSGT